MADEYIRKEDAEDVIAKRTGFETAKRAKKWAMMHPIDLDPWFGAAATAITTVESLEPADVIPVVHAHWIRHENADTFEGYEVPMFECSNCRAWKDDDSDFCPDCGADMRGEQDG